MRERVRVAGPSVTLGAGRRGSGLGFGGLTLATGAGDGGLGAVGGALIGVGGAALGDNFQAKGTLRSVIENFPLENVRENARRKLAKIEEQENKQKEASQSETDSLSVDIKDIEDQ